ncbi:Gfo/Idh/MocA family oxidoreductase [soil metagenome]|nr:Gfo/Idh/MocA family oxidoreductase [Acidobacteriota bacterium]
MSDNAVTRRTFVQTTTAAAAAMMFPSGARVFGSDVVRVGVVGTGGRGTGAIRDVLMSSEGIEITALGDLSPDRLEQSRMQLDKTAAGDAAFGAKWKAGFKVTGERVFTGFDAYKNVVTSPDVDLVILATPPGFRPVHLAAAVAAGKHVFTEKPVATDSVGIRSVLATYETALTKNLGIGAGTQRRHQAEYLATIARLHEGAIGDIVSGQVFWNQGGLWNHPRQPDWSDTEWQIRNWLYFAWLSGDHIVEQHVHNIDVANWVLREHPIRAIAVGGRQQRTDPRYGHIFDHFAVDFEYPSGARIMSMCRQIEGTRNRVGEHFIGTRGSTDPSGKIMGPSAWAYERPEKPVNPYVQEHTNLIASIRAGKPINELKTVAESTLTAILGREAAYTGQELTWDEVLKAELDLTPPNISFQSMEVPPVPMPGVTRLNRSWKEHVKGQA